jgi:hypothetical protein
MRDDRDGGSGETLRFSVVNTSTGKEFVIETTFEGKTIEEVVKELKQDCASLYGGEPADYEATEDSSGRSY